ncbi:hypothetical protein AB4Z52_31535 [Rhizobium sp. 2YAF20]|uniref:hypothetical protein n=1 Tax=Rhizobium sp. 2YAF20 TaxID=3233027 RepID=UPI003F9C74CF
MDLKACREDQMKIIAEIEADIVRNKDNNVRHGERRGMNTGWTDTTASNLAMRERHLVLAIEVYA